MFLSTLDISEQYIKTASRKSDDLTKASPQTRKHQHHVKIDEDLKETVRNHIRSLPTVPSHLCRAQSGREYLEAGLNVTKLWMLYLTHMQQNVPQITPASLRVYRHIFNNEFNKFFHHPRKDQCEICYIWGCLTEEARKKEQEKFDAHMKRKLDAKTLKDDDKKAPQRDSRIVYACYDLQKVMTLPKCPVGQLYYLRKLNVFNFTIWALYGKGKIRLCYVWNESESLRGANEVASAVFKFIEEMVERFEVKEFRFWSDNCSGQNKNRYLLYVYSMYTVAAKFDVTIIHTYMEKGHTFNEGDSMHHSIEEATRYSDVFTPEEWYDFIIKAKPEKERFRLERMAGQVFDFHSLAEDIQVWQKKQGGIKWKQVREFQVNPTNPWEVDVRYDLSTETPPQKVKISKVKGRPINLKSYIPKKSTGGPLKLSLPKQSDLKKMVVNKLIPEKYNAFYETLYLDVSKKTTTSKETTTSAAVVDAEQLDLAHVELLEEMLDFDD